MSDSRGVSVIITSQDDQESVLSNKDYDQLVKVSSLDIIIWLTSDQNCFQSTKFTEYEIVQLWNHFKADFPSGNINQSQLGQMIKKVFPKYVPHYT